MLPSERIREYDRIARLFDHRLGLYARQAIDAALEFAHLTGAESVIDICCGAGELLQVLGLHSHTGRVIGVDFSETMLNVAARRLKPYANIELRKGPADQLTAHDNEFDVAFSTNAFHYLENPEQVLVECRRVLKPHGRLIIVDLAANSQVTRLWLMFRRLFRPAHSRVYRLEEMVQLLEQAGFVPTRRKLKRINLLWSVMFIEAHKPAPPRADGRSRASAISPHA
jgi:ubiquinone/menaquinone biosynthesis C-methylase UbiE